jgi:hypothetical protein
MLPSLKPSKSKQYNILLSHSAAVINGVTEIVKNNNVKINDPNIFVDFE